MTQPTNSVSHLRKDLDMHIGPDGDKADPKPISRSLEAYYQKQENLRGVTAPVIRKAWFTMAHLLLQPGSSVIDMGCSPMMTYAMAAMNPLINFTGIDSSKTLIGEAKKKYSLPNLDFKHDDIEKPSGIKRDSVDAIINSFNLHEVFSHRKYSEKAVVSTLENHFALLKQEGQMFIRDYSMPPPGEYVLIEMPDVESRGDTLEDLSEADLLVWYSEHARPNNDRSCTGFFLEELPARFPQTRLFRLPYKWAYEFIMRKDNREEWENELPQEYTFFTPREYRKNLRGLGARVLYTAPQWEDKIIKERFEGRFRLYDDDGKTISTPPTSFIAVSQKMGEKKSLRLHERRPSNSSENHIRVKAMRNEANGEIFDLVSRDVDLTEVLPYRVTESGALHVFVHTGLPRGIANAVPRSGKELDGKRWSGHMTEAIAIPTEIILDTEKGEAKNTVLFARDYLGLKPAMASMLERGPVFFPAPDFIDEHIKTRYLRVTEHEGLIDPKHVPRDIDGFTTKGHITELDAQCVLNAISVGYLPNARLETQILALCEILDIDLETWDECPLALDEGVPEKTLDTKKFLSDVSGNDKRFKDIKGTAGNLRTVKSIFVDEGWVEGGLEGLASRDIEFVVSEDNTINKAVILPLTKNAHTGVVCGGMVAEHMPVPQRYKGNGLTLSAPSVTLPKEVTTIDQAKQFIAKKFNIPVEKVARLGESYFCHLGVTPMRIFPFAVATTGSANNPFGGPVSFAPLIDLINLLWVVEDWKHDRYILSRYAKVFQRMGGASSEVTGNWSKSANKVYQQLHKTAPKPASSSPSTESKGQGIPGWSSEKSRESSQQAAQRAATSYISSPDFIDIHNESFSTGATASQSHGKQTPANTQSQSKERDSKSKQ